MEAFTDLQKNDDSYGIPHGKLNKKHIKPAGFSTLRYLISAIKPT